MTNKEAGDLLRLAALAASGRNELSHLIANAVLKLHRNARTVAAINVRVCNGRAFPADGRRKERAIGRIEAAARYLFGGLVVVLADGDPRGYSVKLHGLPISNEMGGDWGLA